MSRNPIRKVIDLEIRIARVNLVFAAEVPELLRMLAKPLRDDVIDSHILEIKGLLAIETPLIVGSPESISLDV
jgi:hypothetical protein